MPSLRKIKHRHAQYYNDVLKPLNKQYLSSREDRNIVTEYGLEEGQIEHALDWLKRPQLDPNLILLLQSYLEEGTPLLSRRWVMEYTRKLEAQYNTAEEYEERQIILGHMGYCYTRIGDFESAVKIYEMKINMARKRQDVFSEIQSHHDLSFVFLLQKDFSQASRFHDEVISAMSKVDTSSHIFLSYSREDTETMALLREHLTRAGFKVWVDVSDMEPGVKNFPEKVRKAILASSCMIVIMSPSCVESEWVGLEISAAEIQEIKIFPVMASGTKKTSIPFKLVSTNWAADLREKSKFEEEITKLRNAISKHMKTWVPK